MLAEIKKLEFYKILEQIKKYVVSDLAKQDVLKIEPITNSLEINRLLTEVFQASSFQHHRVNFDEFALSFLNKLYSIKTFKLG